MAYCRLKPEDMMAEGSVPNDVDHAGVKVVPPLIYAGIFIIAWLLHQLFPLPGFPGFLSLSGWFAVLTGVALCLWSIGLFWRQHTSIVPIKPSVALVVVGPYHFTRNPMYLGLLLVYLGAALVLQLAWALILLPVVVVTVDRLVIQKEERYLARKFGGAYSEYQQRVRRWL
jgi:protein-S-isoprenylcysteine O-methyltransferase Ste14